MQGDPAATRPWHYINLPVSRDVDEAALLDYCPDGRDCVVVQIRKDAAVLRDPLAPLEDKQMALMFLVHFVGDEHQPLHGSDGVAEDGSDDKGGNLEPMPGVSYNGKPMSLHAVWDGEIDDPKDVDFRQSDDALTARARDLAAALETDIASKDTADWVRGDLSSRPALESFQIARQTIYPDYRQTRGADSLEAYQRKMRPIALDRIERAGVRLAALLEQALIPLAGEGTDEAAPPIVDQR